MLNKRVLLFESPQLADEVAFQLRGVCDNLNSVVFETEVNRIALDYIVQQHRVSTEYGEFWCFAGERVQKFGHIFSSKWIALFVYICFRGDWDIDNCVYLWPKDVVKLPRNLKFTLRK